ncbi:MAG: hypothetical protein AUK47_18645 [Deltaproteobacteria bacterium CG2_30_63_29]|nr:MAG: hypothetical protein AUK47_18645 [Deltaproteobacteria bacterium CG2_30_63_29]PIW02544.1 MAG: hypothetical protein COW42_01065 [Deltaproteobacteria bacterium CG17_big_fil_post_rev_8_21_14_2_50_63_7]PJB41185.1 MAG: hypothetical protein CO108_13435 [Deltaproteobacteria bacterium CG_4_9_14_3_um_filter_63_12]
MQHTLRQRLSLLTLALVLSLTAGCFGSFGATSMLYRWNNGVSSNKFVKTLVLWAMIIVPVYEVLLVGDFVVFNTIEFWTGNRVFADATIKQLEGGKVLVENGQDTYLIEPLGEQRVRIAVNGLDLGIAAVTEAGDLLFVSADGTMQVFTPESLEAIKSNAMLAATLPTI